MENCGRFSKSESLGCLNCPFDCGILVKQQVYIISFLVKLEGIGPVEVVFFCILFLFSPFAPTMFEDAIEMESTEAILEGLSFSSLQFCQHLRVSIFLHSDSTVEQLM